MKIAIVGAGFLGLSAAYEILKTGSHTVEIYEREPVLGGLAGTFKKDGWEWGLEKAYHHLFTNDYSAISLMKELGIYDACIKTKINTSNYVDQKYYKIDSPLVLLSYDRLKIVDKARTALLIAICKVFNPSIFEKFLCEEFFTKIGGVNAWKELWLPLMQGKFGSYSNKVNAGWLCARIKKRTPSLIYPRGGFAKFLNALSTRVESLGGKIYLSSSPNIEDLKKHYDKVILTCSTNSAKGLFKTNNNVESISKKIPHLWAQVLILTTKEPVLENGTYWLSIMNRDWPFLAVVQHTSMVEPKHYGNNHILYVGNYLDEGHEFLKKDKNELYNIFRPYLNTLNKYIDDLVLDIDMVVLKDAQPVHFTNYSKIVPSKFIKVEENVYLSNMDFVRPWDRGINYAIQLGKDVAKSIILDKTR